jgi:DNA-binding response OmpR family regulator
MENVNYQIGEVQFNPTAKELVFSRFRSVRLSNRENAILQYMLENPNKAITLTEIIAQCLADYPCDPIGTRKTIQLLSAKLELEDNIEYPYIDCYMFRNLSAAQEKSSLFNVSRLKRFLSRSPQMSKALTG